MQSLRATRYQVGFLALLSSGACAPTVADFPAADTELRCAYGAWSELRPFAELSPGVVAAEFSLAPTRSGALLVAEKRPREYLPTPPRWELEDRGLLLFTEDGVPFDGPAGRFWFISPRAAVDASGTLHVLWGEAATDQPFRNSAREEVASIWHSAYDQLSGWSVPVEVYRGGDSERLGWKTVRSVAADPWGGLHTFVGSPTAGMVRLSFANETWSADTVPDIQAVAETDVAVTESGEIYVVFAGSPRLSRSELESRSTATGLVPLNDVYLAVGRVDSDSLSMIAVSVNRGRSSRPAILRGKQGVIHLLWGRDLTGDVFPEVIEHVYSSRPRNEWSPYSELPISGQTAFNTWRSTIDVCGVLHLVISTGVTGETPGFSQKYLRWDGSWSDASTLFSGAVTLENAHVLASPSSREVLLLGSGRSSRFTDSIARYSLRASALRIAPASTGSRSKVRSGAAGF